jgi:hypothetical protein
MCIRLADPSLVNADVLNELMTCEIPDPEINKKL